MNSITAIIISYNDYDSLNRSINSIYFQVDTIIVVDNSTIKERFIYSGDIIYIKNQNNLGLAKALNIRTKTTLLKA